MKAAIFDRHGGPDVVHIADIAVPQPGAGEVRLRVAATSLNHLDLWVRRGIPIETTMPHIGGSDVAGTVDALGPDVSGWREGDRVVVDPSLACGQCPACRRGEEPLCETYRILGEHTQGGLAEFVVVPARNLYRIPAGYPFERAAAAPLAFVTAWRGLVSRGALQAGQTVLITGASGGVATTAIAIARLRGARIFALTSTPWVERVQALGAHRVFDRADPEWGRSLWQATEKRGVDLVFDSVGAALWSTCLRSLARGGRLLTYGATSGHDAHTDIRLLFWKQISIIGTTMGNRREFREVMDHVFAGELEPVIDAVWPLDRVRDAHERLESGSAFGKLVLMP